MNKIVGVLFILIGFCFLYAIFYHLKKIRNLYIECYKTFGVVEKINIIPDTYERTFAKYSVRVRYNDNDGIEHTNVFILPLKNIQVGNRYDILVSKNNPKISYSNETSLLTIYISIIFFIILVLIGFYILFLPTLF